MQITVKLYATLRRYGPELPSGAGFCLEVPAGSDVEKVMERLGIPDGVALVAMVNNKVVHVEHVLVAGDSLSLFPPVAGG
jgi:sulfur carrier protein ThiS